MSRGQELEQSAARWVMRREEPSWSPADEEELNRWLAESDAHKAAFWRLDHGWREADRIASVGMPAPQPAETTPIARWWKPTALAASVALILFLFSIQRFELPAGRAPVREARFETSLGGHKRVDLPDGSRVELNTDTAIKAALSRSGREVWLDRGEAFFDVAKDAGRTFVVHSGSRAVTVVGTEFSVQRSGDDLIVTVLEGRVRLDARGAEETGRSTVMVAGDRAVAAGQTVTVTSEPLARVQDQLAWRGGRLVFSDITLEEAARQFNRYNRRQIVIADEKAARTRIGGSFQSRNVEAFARLLESAYGLDVEAGKGSIVVKG